MLSVSASGTLADTVSYSNWKGRTYARRTVTSANPKTAAQTGRRAMFSFLTANWADAYDEWKATWQDQATALNTSPYHAYVAKNLEDWHNYLAPMRYSNGLRTINPGVITDPFTAAWEEHRIKLTITMTTKNNNWGFIIYASPIPAPPKEVTSTVLVIPMKNVATYSIFWTPPAPGTWYFAGTPFAVDGNLGANISGGST